MARCNLASVKAALERIRPYAHNTPVMTSTTLNSMRGHKLFLKTENFQKTGSFKFRGAMNAVLKIKSDTPDVKRVVTDSSGNHGQALAYAAREAGFDCSVVMISTSPQCKVDSVRGYGAEVVFCEPSEKARKQESARLCKELNAVYVSSSQNYDVIAGQGTMGLEIMEQNPDIDVIVVAVGGGGMISGIATAIKEMKPSVKIIAAEPELANDCYVSKRDGVLTPNAVFPNTIADGVRVSIGSVTWPIIHGLVDDVITVTEAEIKKATLLVWERCKLAIEPTAGVPVAAVLSTKFNESLNRLLGNASAKNVSIVLCGGNIDFAVFPRLFES